MSSHRIIINPYNLNSVSHAANPGIFHSYIRTEKSECCYYHAIKHTLFHANDGIINCKKLYSSADREIWNFLLQGGCFYTKLRCVRNTVLIYFKFPWHQKLTFIDLFIFTWHSEAVKKIIEICIMSSKECVFCID